MTAQLIDGNALAKQLRAEAAQRAAALTARGHQPGLAVILVGEDPASQVYVRNKIKACEDNGFLSVFDRYPAENPFGRQPGFLGAIYPLTSPFGYNGGFAYLRLEWSPRR